MDINLDQENLNTTEKINRHQQNKKLVASELGDLFANYLGDSLFSCFIEHHLQVVEDDEIKEFIEFSLANSKEHLSALKEIYAKENIPVPVGFGAEDIRKDAPRLFSDIFIAFYITAMTRTALVTYADALSTSSRQDIVDYIKICLNDSVITYEKGLHLLLTKGKYTSVPEIPYPLKVDFIEKESFISIIAGKFRPLTASEIKHLHVNLNTNILGKALMLGFSQVASSDKLRRYFQEGAKVSDKQIKSLGAFLISENIPTPNVMDAHITDSTIPPYSDKLMLYHAALANTIGITNYGLAVAKMMRHDLHTQIMMLIVDIAKYANEGINLTIGNGWLEEPPTAADRKKLSNHSSGNRPME